ncbi:porin [Pseudomonas sp. GOM7]|uniref:OprO/OprP family phosphate-selective porin n=1 Tax=Pseudomonas sp. GOM7 TaxID=2998079 RepID=UPI00227A3AC3|nr:porin [Pseudomonas sp. GOM7]WAJ38895.1 porin [Pseudomonas sp. GOM7]
MIRKHFAGFAASALALAVSAQAFAGTVTTDGADIVIKTKGGFEASTTDKQFGFKLGGRLQADYDQFDGIYTKNGKTANEAYFRRAILEISGVAYTDWKYAFNVDFGESGSSKWDEASITYTGFKPVNVKIGRFDPDFGLEKATSSKWITAIERSAIYDLADWVNDKQDGMGMQVSGVAGDMFYGSAGFNRAKGNEDVNGKNNNTYNLRAVFAPMAEAGNVLHFGVDYAKRSTEDFDGRVRSRMGVRGTTEDSVNGNRPDFAPAVTGQFDADSAWGLEAAFAAGPFSVQSEYLKRDIDAKSGSVRNDREATGYNVQVAYTLTGEARGYKLDGGKFDSIKPNDKQMGAWEVFYRYDNIKAEESDFVDTKAKIHTVGVNWYANEAVKVSANYLKASTDKVTNSNRDDDGDAVSMRLQYVF